MKLPPEVKLKRDLERNLRLFLELGLPMSYFASIIAEQFANEEITALVESLFIHREIK